MLQVLSYVVIHRAQEELTVKSRRKRKMSAFTGSQRGAGWV